MDLTIYPTKLHGNVRAIPSKSQAHRLMICAAFSDTPTFLECSQTNEDIEATARCLCSLGANISRSESGYTVIPVENVPESAILDCGESGSTLRFLLPVACALGVSTTFVMHGRLPYRPLSPLWEELERMGCLLSRPTENTIATAGKLSSGNFYISGSVSSQYISGLLFATALMNGESKIIITDTLESKPYVEMTQLALSQFDVNTEGFCIKGSYPFHSPGKLCVEGDWSNSSFFLVANALGSNVNVINLNEYSPQGDRAIRSILSNPMSFQNISAVNIPDLIPILAVLYGTTSPIVFSNIGRLRLKESDRVATVCDMLNKLGATASVSENTLTIIPGKFHRCTIQAAGDHRIAMAAAIAATVSDGPITISGAECVAKSYPDFWNVYRQLGGKYE